MSLLRFLISISMFVGCVILIALLPNEKRGMVWSLFEYDSVSIKMCGSQFRLII